MADDDDTGFRATYDNGHWQWDETIESLIFISDLPPETVEAIQLLTKAPTGTVEFRDDVDLIEQIRFRRRYQRKVKAGQPDVITVQDVKDIALFTAPVSIMSPMLINMLHLATTERFIRALIIYCQYYLQFLIFAAGYNLITTSAGVGFLHQFLSLSVIMAVVTLPKYRELNHNTNVIEHEMVNRMSELEKKVRTPDCDLIEVEYRDNLADLRLLVSKEYSTMMLGGSDMKTFHHMGAQKKRRSLSDKDARLFETLLRMCVQIVWLALGRKAFNQIELEVNRLFKSEIYNAAEHNLRTGYIHKMSKEEHAVLLGHCVRHDKKLNTRSPLMNEIFCHRQIDFRMFALGVIKYHHLSPRLQYMLMAVSAPEADLFKYGVSVGILGLSRSCFDTMLRPLPSATSIGKSKSVISTNGNSTSSSLKSTMSTVKKSQQSLLKFYDDIVLPVDEREMNFPEIFPDDPEEVFKCSEVQRRRWLNKLLKLFHPQAPQHRAV